MYRIYELLLLIILIAQLSLEDSLLEMRKCKTCNVTLQRDKAWNWLYYVLRLARKA